jgi:hypothetical protein
MSFVNNGFMVGLFSLIISPVAFIVFAVIVRVWLEFVIVVFRIADYTKILAENTKRSLAAD